MHPAHAARAALRPGPKGRKIVGGQTGGRDCNDMRGAAEPEDRNARLVEVLTVNAWRRIALLTGVAARDPLKRRI